MTEPNFKKYAQEMFEMAWLPPVSVELPPLASVAIISHIQLASRHPEMADSAFTKMAIGVAKQLQNLFPENSETYKVIELGWDPETDILTDPEKPSNGCGETISQRIARNICESQGCSSLDM